MRASVVIPTLNGGKRLVAVLESVLGQQTPWPFEVIVVDSDSNDGTESILAQMAQKIEHLRLVTIRRSDFGHGRTRNFGIELSRGEFAVLITQDAEPASPTWLATLVDGVATVADAAGGFGRHLPYPDTNPFVARDLQRHFDGLATQPSERFIRDRAVYDSDVRVRQSLHFHSDNNACIRRSYWEDHPLPDISFGEDQVWANGVILRGDKLVYVDGAAVRHAHNYGMLEAFLRAKEEASFYAREFGYVMEKGLVHGVARAIRQTRRDIAYFYRLPKPRPAWEWVWLAGGLNLACRMGYWWGTKMGKV